MVTTKDCSKLELQPHVDQMSHQKHFLKTRKPRLNQIPFHLLPYQVQNEHQEVLDIRVHELYLKVPYNTNQIRPRKKNSKGETR